MPDKITTLKLIDNTDVFPNIKDENIPDTIMRIADLSKYLNQLKSINITGDIDSTTVTSDIATFTTANISTLNVSGISQFEGEATFGHDVHLDGNLVVNGIDNIVDKNGNKIVKNETLDEFTKRFYQNCDVGLYLSDTITEDTSLLRANDVLFVPYADKVTNLDSLCENATIKSKYDDRLHSLVLPDIANIVSGESMFSQIKCASVRLNNLTLNRMVHMFSFSKGLVSVEVADGKEVKFNGNAWWCFAKSKSLVEIGKIDMNGVDNTTSMFFDCISLKHIHCTNWRISFDISDSTAFEQSDLVEIISNLKSVSTPKTLTMGSTNLAKLTQEQILVATGKGWTLA